PPSNARILAIELRHSGEPERALEIQLALRRQQPDDFWVHLSLGLTCSRMKPPRWDQAVRYYTAAVALRPRSPNARINLAQALREGGSFDEAIAEYQEAIRLNPSDAQAHTNLSGVLWQDKHDYDRAMVYVREAIRLDPSFADAHNNLGAVLCDAK